MAFGRDRDGDLIWWDRETLQTWVFQPDDGSWLRYQVDVFHDLTEITGVRARELARELGYSGGALHAPAEASS